MKTKLALALLAFSIIGVNLKAANLPAALPEFMNPSQLAKWNADKTAASASATVSAGDSDVFFTGKPYVAEANGYVFKYRTYSPEMSRWTSADSSGFPDGVNNNIYAPTATSEVDPNGLWTVSLTSGSTGSGSGSWTIGYGYLGHAEYDATSFNVGSTQIYTGNTISGFSGVSGPVNGITLTPTLTVSVDSNGNLSYSLSGSFQQTAGAVSAAINFSITGENTQTMTVHVTAGDALNASAITGGGASTSGATISITGTTYSNVFAIGDYHFQASE